MSKIGQYILAQQEAQIKQFFMDESCDESMNVPINNNEKENDIENVSRTKDD